MLCACRKHELSCKPEQQWQQPSSATRVAVQHGDIPYPNTVGSSSASLLHARYVTAHLEANCCRQRALCTAVSKLGLRVQGPKSKPTCIKQTSTQFYVSSLFVSFAGHLVHGTGHEMSVAAHAENCI